MLETLGRFTVCLGGFKKRKMADTQGTPGFVEKLKEYMRTRKGAILAVEIVSKLVNTWCLFLLSSGNKILNVFPVNRCVIAIYQ